MEYYDSVCFLSVVFTSRCIAKFDILRDRRSSELSKFSNASRSKYNRQETHTIIIFYIYFMLSGRISRNIGKNIFRSYTGSTSENTDFHVLVVWVNCACLTTRWK